MCLNLFTKTVYVDHPVEVIKEVPIYPDLDDFENEDALKAWFDLHKELRMESPNLCDDYSRETRSLATMDGYNMEVYLMANGICYTTQIFDSDCFHVGNLAICKDDQSCWYVDLAFSKLIKVCNFHIGGKH